MRISRILHFTNKRSNLVRFSLLQKLALKVARAEACGYVGNGAHDGTYGGHLGGSAGRLGVGRRDRRADPRGERQDDEAVGPGPPDVLVATNRQPTARDICPTSGTIPRKCNFQQKSRVRT